MKPFALAASVLGALLLLAAPVHAHGRLVRSAPAADARLTAVPREIRLAFSERPELAFTRISLVGPDRAAFALGELRAVADSPRVIAAAISGALVPGRYVVSWQTAGRDGHPTRGSFAFTIAEGASGLPTAAVAPPGTAPAAASPPREHAEPVRPRGTRHAAVKPLDASSPLFVAIRWLTFVGIFLVVGAVCFAVLLAPAAGGAGAVPPDVAVASRHRAALIGIAAALLLAAVTGVRLAAQARAMAGVAGLGAMLSRTVWGWGWITQMAGALLVAAAFAVVRRGGTTRWLLPAVVASVLAFTPALSGHAAAAEPAPALAVLTDGVHVLGAAAWLGTLALVALAGLPVVLRLAPGERGPAAARLVNAFSPLALVAAGAAAGTGVISAWLELRSVSALWSTAYGRALLIKLAAVALVVAAGAYNWQRVRPSLGTDATVARIRRSVATELAVAAVVLVITAVLVALPTPAAVLVASP